MLFDSRNNIESPFNLGLFIKGGSTAFIEKYFNDLLYQFSKELNILTYRLSFEKMFTDIEFNKQIPDENEESFINKHFYSKLFGDLKKKWVPDTVKQKDILVWDYKVNVCFTLDKILTQGIIFRHFIRHTKLR